MGLSFAATTATTATVAGSSYLNTLPQELRDLVAHLPDASTRRRQLNDPTANTSPLLLQAMLVTGCSMGWLTCMRRP